MKKIIFIFALFVLISLVSSNLYYEINLVVKENKLSIDSIDLIYSRFEMLNPYIDKNHEISDLFDFDINEYNYDLLIYDTQDLLTHSEKISILIYYIEDLENDVQKSGYLEDFNFTLYFPHSEDTKKIILEQENEIILEHDILNRTTTPDEAIQKTEEINNTFILFVLSFLIILIILFVILYFVLSKKNNKLY